MEVEEGVSPFSVADLTLSTALSLYLMFPTMRRMPYLVTQRAFTTGARPRGIKSPLLRSVLHKKTEVDPSQEMREVDYSLLIIEADPRPHSWSSTRWPSSWACTWGPWEYTALAACCGWQNTAESALSYRSASFPWEISLRCLVCYFLSDISCTFLVTEVWTLLRFFIHSGQENGRRYFEIWGWDMPWPMQTPFPLLGQCPKLSRVFFIWEPS